MIVPVVLLAFDGRKTPLLQCGMCTYLALRYENALVEGRFTAACVHNT